MRFVPTNCLRPGQSLATDLIIGDNKALLRAGVELTAQLINRLRTLGYQGVYIDDELSKDIQVVNIISNQLKTEVTSKLRHLYISAENKWNKKVNSQFSGLDTSIADLVDEILNHRHVVVSMVDLRTYDDYTFSHSLNVAVLSVVIGTALELPRSDLQELAMGAIVHDIGKVSIDKDIINKPSRLTDDEYAAVKLHSTLGYDYIADKIGSQKAKQVVLSHHEHFNGCGYPYGLKGEEIPLLGRIACVADVYDALTSDRPYRTALSPSEAFEYIMGQNDVLFEPRIVTAFTRKVMPYPVGTCVRLSTNDIAIVTNNYESSSLRPVVRLLQDQKLTDEYIDLTHDITSLNITIQEVVNI